MVLRQTLPSAHIRLPARKLHPEKQPVGRQIQPIHRTSRAKGHRGNTSLGHECSHRRQLGDLIHQVSEGEILRIDAIASSEKSVLCPASFAHCGFLLLAAERNLQLTRRVLRTGDGMHASAYTAGLCGAGILAARRFAVPQQTRIHRFAENSETNPAGTRLPGRRAESA